MKVKITHNAVIVGMIVLLIGMIFLTFWLFNDYTHIFNDKILTDSYHKGESDFGWIHMSINTLMGISYVVWLIFFIWETSDNDKTSPLRRLYCNEKDCDYQTDDIEKENKPKTFRWKRWVWIAILIIVLLQIFKLGKTVYNQSVFVYNTSKKYHNTYQQKVEEKIGYYDKLWKTYLQKEKIANVNKETFIEVTKVIMNNVADGKNLSWKWVSRYPDIDYNQFSAFYADLSDFIAEQREGYFSIEKACQAIANQNNTLLDTFPNNIYNRFLKQERINFEYGFLSDSTENVFKTKKENLK